MKKLLLLFFLFHLKEIIAQDAINYQAVVRNNTGGAIANSNVNFRVSILTGSITGTSVYTETNSDNTNNFGLVNLQIGKGIVQSGSFASIDWSTQKYMKIEFDATGGSNFIDMGTTQLLSVPYALYAKDAATVKQAKTLIYLTH